MGLLKSLAWVGEKPSSLYKMNETVTQHRSDFISSAAGLFAS